MKLFIDSANLSEIKEIHRLGILDGVTTNPSLIAKESIKSNNGKDFRSIILEIADLVDGPVSAEVISTDAEGMIREAMELSRIHRNVVVKIPLIEEGIRAVSSLSREGISTNVTLCFSANQALLAAKVGASYISPFVGRLDDAGQDGMTLIEEIMTIYQNFDMDTQIISASMRGPMHVLESAKIGADIVTAPYSVLKALFRHPLTDIGLEKFLKDWMKKEKQDILKK